MSINLLNSLVLDPEQWQTDHQRLKEASSLSTLVRAAFQMGLWLARCLVEQELEQRAQVPTEWPDCPHCGRHLHSKGWRARQMMTWRLGHPLAASSRSLPRDVPGLAVHSSR